MTPKRPYVYRLIPADKVRLHLVMKFSIDHPARVVRIDEMEGGALRFTGRGGIVRVVSPNDKVAVRY